LHIGNYFGSIKNIVERQKENEVMAFIANYHAQTSCSDGEKLHNLTRQCAIDFLALGIDPDKSVFWVQSHSPLVLEFYWILSSFTSMGLLERAHSYKDKVAKGVGANHSLFSYPVLMASDILLYSSQIVPVGKDQIQHLEITRDIAIKFNNQYGDILTIPEYLVDENTATINGVDGAKMSKSYNNTIDIFSEDKVLKKQIKKIITDSTPLEEPKDYENCNVYNIAKNFLNKDECKELQERYKSGKEGYGHFKEYLRGLISDYFSDFKEKRDYYIANPKIVDNILKEGAKKANDIASSKMKEIRKVVGI
jgi:tryptophanyl-tRNA synthetase